MPWSQVAGSRSYSNVSEARKALGTYKKVLPSAKLRIVKRQGTLGANPQPYYVIEAER